MSEARSGWRPRGSVWATGQDSARVQRGGYVLSSTPHPAKMLPAIARHAICAYSKPGDIVLDPMCGIGTTLVEAVRAGRHAVGVEYEPRWAAVAAANLHATRVTGERAKGVTGTVLTGDSRELTRLLPRSLRGRVDLVVTSPPYGSGVHGRVAATGTGVMKFDSAYGSDPHNLAYQPLDGLRDGLVDILAACREMLTGTGRIVLTARPFRKHGALVDFPGMVTTAAVEAGLVPLERCVALMAAWRDGSLVARPSFFTLNNARTATANGRPTAVVVHEDVLVFTKPTTPRARKKVA